MAWPTKEERDAKAEKPDIKPDTPAKKVAVILHYDAWDEDGVRHKAAPQVGINAVNQPIRLETTMLSKEQARALVLSGKAQAPFVADDD